MSELHRHPQTSNLQREIERLRRELADKDRQLQRQGEQIASVVVHFFGRQLA